MKVLVACEFSGIVREAFRKRGHEAYSCDILPTEISSEYHIQKDIKSIDLKQYDLVIAHPPCTAVCLSGNKHYSNTQARLDGIQFIKWIWDNGPSKLCIENPVGVINTYLPELPRPQYIHPWQFGHGIKKMTGLWKRGLPDLEPTDIVDGRSLSLTNHPENKDRWKNRSRTFTGIAVAMAEQWG